jgi:hypothetical protein
MATRCTASPKAWPGIEKSRTWSAGRRAAPIARSGGTLSRTASQAVHGVPADLAGRPGGLRQVPAFPGAPLPFFGEPPECDEGAARAPLTKRAAERWLVTPGDFVSSDPGYAGGVLKASNA